MFLKGPLGAFEFLQEKASFVDPKAAIEKLAKAISINLAYLFMFVPPHSARAKAAIRIQQRRVCAHLETHISARRAEEW